MSAPHRYKVGDKVYLSEERMEHMRWHNRQAAHPGFPSDSFLLTVSDFVGHIGEVTHTHEPGYEVTVAFPTRSVSGMFAEDKQLGEPRSFHMKDNWIEPINARPAPYTIRTMGVQGRTSYEPMWSFDKPWQAVCKGEVFNNFRTREEALQALEKKGCLVLRRADLHHSGRAELRRYLESWGFAAFDYEDLEALRNAALQNFDTEGLGMGPIDTVRHA